MALENCPDLFTNREGDQRGKDVQGQVYFNPA